MLLDVIDLRDSVGIFEEFSHFLFIWKSEAQLGLLLTRILWVQCSLLKVIGNLELRFLELDLALGLVEFCPEEIGFYLALLESLLVD